MTPNAKNEHVSGPPPACVSFRLLVLRTNQIERCLAFYRSLGITFVLEQHGTGPLHYAADVDGVVFELYPLTAAQVLDAPDVRLGFAVARLSSTLDELAKAGGVVTSKPKDGPWGLRAVVRDPDGRAVELYEWTES